MRKLIRTLLALGVLGSMTGAVPANALVYSECRANYVTAPASCVFTPVGPEIWVTGHGALTGAGVTVRVTDPTTNVTLLECHGTYDCYAHIGTSTPTDSVGPPAGLGPLVCQVVVGKSGSFSCSSRS